MRNRRQRWIIKTISIAVTSMIVTGQIGDVFAASVSDYAVTTELEQESSIVEDSVAESETGETEETEENTETEEEAKGETEDSEEETEDTQTEATEETGETEDMTGVTEETEETEEAEETEAVEETEETEGTETVEETEETEETEELELYSGIKGDAVLSGGYLVYQVSAEEIDSLQSVLNEAAEVATEDCPCKIIIEPGTYTLSKTLRISSNTYLYMQGVTFQQPSGASRNMLKVGINTGDESGYCYKNITLYGGTWDKNGNTGSSVIKVGHAANFSMQNVTVENVENGHLMEAAGINGFYIKNCYFLNQTINTATMTSTVPVYEAIQLDILEATHSKGYTSEDLKNQNITVESCTFRNVPRGVGNHTSILNNPTENVKISNNIFENISDVAFRGEGYLNLAIKGNVMKNCRNGIMVISLRCYGGTYLGSTLAAEGGTTAVSSSEYCKPASDQKIVISNNTIICSDSVGNAGELSYGILVEGARYTEDVVIAGKDTIPAGDYYISGVKISNNSVKAIQNGIVLTNTKNAKVTSNQLQCSPIASGYGIYLTQRSTKCTVTGNTITKFSGSGIYIDEGSSAKSVSENTIKSVGAYGIVVDATAVDKILSNTVTNAGNKGIVAYNNATVGRIEKNVVKTCSGYGITVGSVKKDVSIKSNIVTRCEGNQIYVNTDTTKRLVTISKNTLKGTIDGSGIRVDSGKIKVASNKIDTCGVGVYLYTGVKGTIDKNTYKKISMYPIYIVKQYNGTKYQTYKNLSTPASLKATAKSKSSIKLTWKKVKGASGYDIYRSTTKDGTYEKIATVSAKKATSYTDKKLKKNKRYYYKVIAYTKSSNKNIKIRSAYTSAVSAKTKKK